MSARNPDPRTRDTRAGAPSADDPLGRALTRVGDRWTMLVVDALLDRPRRFSELADAVQGIAPNILTARLRQLERDGVVVARPYSQRPVRMSYELTSAGRDLATALTVLRSWGARHEGLDDPRHHAACGTAVELRPWCPTCDRVVDDDEAADTSWC